MIHLLASPEQLKQYSIISGDLDPDKDKAVIERAQVTHIKNALGTDLYDRLQEAGDNDDLTTYERTLIDDYINPALIYWAIYDFIKVAPYTVSNTGVFKHTPEVGETLDFDEVDSVAHYYQNYASHYTANLISYLQSTATNTVFPEYYTNTGSDTKPSTNSKFGGWYI